MNNSYSIDLFEQRAAQIIQVNNQKVKLKEIRFQELHSGKQGQSFSDLPCEPSIYEQSNHQYFEEEQQFKRMKRCQQDFSLMCYSNFYWLLKFG